MPPGQRHDAQRAALSARVSSDLQSAGSIEDQLRICAEWATTQGLQVVESYTDQGISGATLIRPGIRKLLQDAADGKFDLILTESLDASPGTRRTSRTSTSGCASTASGSSPCPKAR